MTRTRLSLAAVVAVLLGPPLSAQVRTQAMLRVSGELLPERGGYKLTAVDPNGPCADLDKADFPGPGRMRGILEVGDVILRIDGQSFADLAEFRRLLDAGYRANGGTVRLRVRDVSGTKSDDFIARPVLVQVADPAAEKPPADPRSWVGTRVVPVRPGVKCVTTDAKGANIGSWEITDPAVTVAAENGTWVHIRQGNRAGWCPRVDVVAADRAVAYFAKRTQADPTDTYAYAARAAAHAELKEYDLALAEYLTAAAAEPRNPRWVERAAGVYEAQGNLSAATREYARANDLNPERRAQQEGIVRELAAARAALAERERSYSVRESALVARATTAAPTAEEREEIAAERAALIRTRESLNAKAEELAVQQARTGQPEPLRTEPTPKSERDITTTAAKLSASALESLSGLQLDLASSSPVTRHTDEGEKPVITGTWEPAGGRGWFVYEFEAEGKDGGKVVRRPGQGNIDSSAKYGTWKAKDAKTVVLELPASGRPGYSSYSPGRTVEVKIVSASELSIGGDPYRGGQVKYDDD